MPTVKGRPEMGGGDGTRGYGWDNKGWEEQRIGQSQRKVEAEETDQISRAKALITAKKGLEREKGERGGRRSR